MRQRLVSPQFTLSSRPSRSSAPEARRQKPAGCTAACGSGEAMAWRATSMRPSSDRSPESAACASLSPTHQRSSVGGYPVVDRGVRRQRQHHIVGIIGEGATVKSFDREARAGPYFVGLGARGRACPDQLAVGVGVGLRIGPRGLPELATVRDRTRTRAGQYCIWSLRVGLTGLGRSLAHAADPAYHHGCPRRRLCARPSSAGCFSPRLSRDIPCSGLLIICHRRSSRHHLWHPSGEPISVLHDLASGQLSPNRWQPRTRPLSFQTSFRFCRHGG